jgi:hypothetical protein
LTIYRMEAVNLEVAKPLLIWLNEPDHPKPADEVSTAVAAIESWLMRRMMMRLTTSDLGESSPASSGVTAAARSRDSGVRIRDQLARETTQSGYWPGDDDVRAGLSELLA